MSAAPITDVYACNYSPCVTQPHQHPVKPKPKPEPDF